MGPGPLLPPPPQRAGFSSPLGLILPRTPCIGPRPTPLLLPLQWGRGEQVQTPSSRKEGETGPKQGGGHGALPLPAPAPVILYGKLVSELNNDGAGDVKVYQVANVIEKLAINIDSESFIWLG